MAQEPDEQPVINEEEALAMAEQDGLIVHDIYYVVERSKTPGFDLTAAEAAAFPTRQAAEKALAKQGDNYTIVQTRSMVAKEEGGTHAAH